MPTYTITTDKDAERIAELVRGLSTENKAWDVVVRKHVKSVSDPQRKLYWSCVTILGNELGYDKDEMHDALREKFLPVEEVEILGVIRKRLTSTSARDFGVSRMSAYIDDIYRFAAQELGILLPHPEDDHYQTISGM